MSLPIASDLLGMDYSFCGEPFVIASASSNLWLSEMDMSFAGEPFGWLIGGTYLVLTEADLTYLGEPFIWICVPLIDTSGMDYSYVGEPYVVNYGWGGVPPIVHNIDKANTASWWTRIKNFGGKIISVIKEVNTTPP